MQHVQKFSLQFLNLNTLRIKQDILVLLSSFKRRFLKIFLLVFLLHRRSGKDRAPLRHSFITGALGEEVKSHFHKTIIPTGEGAVCFMVHRNKTRYTIPMAFQDKIRKRTTIKTIFSPYFALK